MTEWRRILSDIFVWFFCSYLRKGWLKWQIYCM